MIRHRSIIRILLTACVVLDLVIATPANRPIYLAYEDARPILEVMREVLPEQLRGTSPDAWREWVVQQDAAIRSRLERGEEDSLVNLLLFGTSFTGQPRMTAKKSDGVPAVIEGRIRDLLAALAAPGDSERLLFARQLLARKGYSYRTATGQARIREYLLANLTRVLQEQEAFQEKLAAAKRLGNTTEEFAERSKLYSSRGLAPDTSLRPNFAIEESLRAMQARRLIARVRRVAVIGPGLDLADKQAGYDFYPPQTLQPFAVIDTLARLGLARIDDIEVTTLDLNPQVNDHIRRARERARRDLAYRIQLPFDMRVPWKPAVIRYWEQLGNEIGAAATPLPVPQQPGGLKTRAVRIRPAVASHISSVDLNVVMQHLALADDERFDLIVATNVFVYYNEFEQTLALKNVERMLKPGGFLLSNNALLELPSSKIHSVNNLTVIYSNRPDDGDHIVWYQRSAE